MQVYPMAGGTLEVGFLVACAGAVCMGSLSCVGGSLAPSPTDVAAPRALFATFSRGSLIPSIAVIDLNATCSYKGGAWLCRSWYLFPPDVERL